MVYTKDKTWSTIRTSSPMSEKDVYQQCDLKFILMGKGHFVQLIKKPSVTMPLIPLQPMENVYESGYYEHAIPADNTMDTNITPDTPSTDHPIGTDDSPTGNVEYCAVHSCEVPKPHKDTPGECPTAPKQDSVSFPIAAKVCEMTSSSALQEFNPLNDSEPNLEFDMTDQNNAENPNLHVKLMQDARTRKWQVKIRNLTQEQVDFIFGPKLLPTLAKTDAFVIKHHDTETPEMHDDAIHGHESTSDNTGPGLPLLDSGYNAGNPPTITTMDTDKGEMTPAIKPK